MTHADDGRIERLERLVEGLSSRLDALEGRGAAPAEPTPIAPPVPAAAPPRPAAVARPATPPPPSGAKARLFAAEAASRQAHRPTKPHTHVDAAAIERVLGGRVFAVLGALVVIAGVALFLKLAYDQGWLAQISGRARCIWAASFGGALLVLGEFARKRWGALAGSGLTATGLGAIYASAYAAHALFELVAPPAALFMLSMTAALGVAIGVRGRLASVSIVSLLGGYAAPLLLTTPAAPAMLGAFWLALLGVGLSVALWRGEAFRGVRTVAWWGTIVLGGSWALNTGQALPAHTVVFLALAWGMIHADRILSSTREQFKFTETDDRPPIELVGRAARPLLASFSTTAWAGWLSAVNFAWSGSEAWLPLAALFVATSLLALTLAGNLRVLCDTPRTGLERLGAAMAVQAGALLIAVMALALAGWLEVGAWAALGAASICAGRWLRARSLDVYGVVVLAIATFRLWALEWWIIGPGAMTVSFAGLELTRLSLLAALVGVAWLAGWAMLRDDNAGVWRGARRTLAAVGVTVMFLSLLTGGATPTATVTTLAAMGFTLALTARWLASLGVTAYAMTSLLFTLAVFAAVFTNPDRYRPEVVEWRGLALSSWTLASAALGAAAIGAGLLTRRVLTREQAALAFVAMAMGMGALLLAPLTEASDPRAVTVAWLALAFAVRIGLPLAAWSRAERFAVAGVIAASAMWGAAYIEPGWFASDEPLGQHPGLWPLGGIVLVMLLMARNWPKDATGVVSRVFLGVLLAAAGLLTLTGTSLEVARIGEALTDDQAARRAAVSIWWGLFGAGALALGSVRRWTILRRCGLALIGVATTKAVLWDLTDVAPGWRVASFLGLGLLMLLVAVGYTRGAARARRAHTFGAQPLEP